METLTLLLYSTDNSDMTNYQLYLKNISEAMVAAQAFVSGMGFDAFVADDKTASAVLQKLKIVGEAAKKVPETIRQDYPQGPLAADGRDARPDYSCILCS